MRILVINGSPRGENSNTIKLTNTFTSQLIKLNSSYQTKVINISKSVIGHCKGCFSCWNHTPGECIIKDDMNSYLKDYIESDIIIWSFPLYYFGMPSKVKAFMDRLLPLNDPAMKERDDGGIEHKSRYNLSSKKIILISTCGFCDVKNNYEALIKQFDILYREKYHKILCPEGELIRYKGLEKRVNIYLNAVKEAATDLYKNNCFSDLTKKKLQQLIIPREVFLDSVKDGIQ